jgi:Tfp pilus assembly protein PilE
MSRSTRGGFSLIQMLVIICIVAIAIGLLLPATRHVGVASARIQCVNHLKQLMFAMDNFESTNGPRTEQSTCCLNLPAEGTFPTGCIGVRTTPEKKLSWMVAILPFLEQNTLYQRIDLEKAYAGNLPTCQTGIKTFLRPAGKEAGTLDPVTHYVAMSGIGHFAAQQPADTPGNGFMGYDRLTSFKTISDGASNTIALMETRADIGPWARGGNSTLRGYDPAESLLGDNPPFSGHSKGWNAAMVDGPVRSLQSSIDPKLLSAAITIAGGESINWD